MKRTVWSGSAIFILLAICFGSIQVYAQTEDSADDDLRYFPDTGHTVGGDFLKTYDSATNPNLIYGNPITEAFERDYQFIQYFERARFELHPENPPELRVVITLLGSLLHESKPSFPRPGSIPGCRYFPETGYHICYDFLEFFDANGGAAQFGYPISNQEILYGRVVQHFQRARFVWHPELPSGEQVLLADLGKEYFILMDENPRRLFPVKPPTGSDKIRIVRELLVRSSFESPVTHPSGSQIVYVIVQDQKLDAVEGAKIELTVSLPSGESLTFKDLTTNQNGFIKQAFSFSNQPPGAARVRIIAAYADLSKKTSNSYWIWR